MTARFAKFLLCTSLLVSGGVQATYACGPSLYADEGRFAMYRADLGSGNSLEPFYYSERFLNSYASDPDGKDYKRNCAEWKAFTKDIARESDIYEIQYNTDPDDFLYASNTGNWGDMKDNTFVQWLTRKENKEALAYLKLAKRFEFAQFKSTDPWADPDRSNDSGLIYEVANEAGLQCHKTHNPFLRERYAFQAVKSWYYAQRGDSVIAIYDRYLGNSKSVIKGWALLYYGMSHTGIDRTRYLLHSFDKSEEKKVFCYNQVRLADLDSLAREAKDKETLLLVQVMRALKTPGRAMELIRSIHQIDPSSKYLPLLIGREINKVEDWVWSPEVLNFYSALQTSYFSKQMGDNNYDDYWKGYDVYVAKNLEKDKAYLADLKGWLIETAGQGNSNKDLYHLAIAHLDNMQGKYSDALERLNGLGAFTDTAMETQRLLDRCLAMAYVKDVLLPRTRQELAADMNKIKALNAGIRGYDQAYDEYGFKQDPGDERSDDLAELMLLLSLRFKERGDRVTAGLLYNKADLTSNIYDSWYAYNVDSGVSYKYIAWWDREAEPSDIDSVLALKHNGPGSDFEKLIAPARWALDDFYKDLKGTLLMRKKQYKAALAVFQSMDKDFWERHYEYKNFLPASTIKSLGTLTPWDYDPHTPRYALNSKALIAADLVNLLDSITVESNKEQLAEYYYRLGNAQFSLTYYGKAWMMMSYGNSIREGKDATGDFAYFTFYPNNKRYGKDYYECREAMAMYQKAIALTRKQERKAAALLMLNLCDNLRHEYNRTAADTITYQSPYLGMIIKKYGDTRTVADAISYCPDIRIP